VKQEDPQKLEFTRTSHMSVSINEKRALSNRSCLLYACSQPVNPAKPYLFRKFEFERITARSAKRKRRAESDITQVLPT
jgi:hypothetical protein